MKRWICGLAAVLAAASGWVRLAPAAEPAESGGALSPEQASYDVLSYDLALAVDPERRTIQGSLSVEARVVRPLRWLVLDLDAPLKVTSTTWLTGEGDRRLDFQRSDRQVRVRLPGVRPIGETIRVRVDYGGRPREARRPPWSGGFVWSKTATGLPWIAVACQLEGADLWWPTKDHPSDEPERMTLRFTVPKPLVAVSNGVPAGVVDEPDGRRTFHWRIDNPVNAYNVTVNIAPYRAIRGTYSSVDGQNVPMTYWVLPENFEKGRRLFEQFPRQMRFLEETIGPYPFRGEKYGAAETPYLGMEHQTLIAYGNRYRDNALGFDALLLHELAHEWWGNLVTVGDWKDYWIHEGFATYMELLYAESLGGRPALRRMAAKLTTRNADPLAPEEPRTTVGKYFVAPEYTRADGDVNAKGALTLHALRWLIGDEAFFRSLRRFAYPVPPAPGESGACRCRIVDTEEFIETVETVHGADLDWFFEVYLRQPRLPRLKTRRGPAKLELEWEVPNGLSFPMPVEVTVGGRSLRLEMPEGRAELAVASRERVSLDPDGWVLREKRPPSSP